MTNFNQDNQSPDLNLRRFEYDVVPKLDRDVQDQDTATGHSYVAFPFWIVRNSSPHLQPF